ncbi:MAG: YiiD C-terminal domain-containing protein [Deltaproteobacteria bacterium]|nr:YiiD C-terminal domain-containing protein [Deltaproteobacteria bacterium]
MAKNRKIGEEIMSAIEKDIEAWLKSNLPVYDFMDFTIISASNGLYKCLVPLNKNTGNHINTVHAAFQWASAEMLGGIAVLATRSSKKYVPVVRNMYIEFIAPASTDICSEALFSNQDAEKMNLHMKNSGHYDFELSSNIKNTDGKVVAKAKSTYAVKIMK